MERKRHFDPASEEYVEVGGETGLNVVLSLAEDGEDGEEVAEGEVDDDGDKDGAVDVHDAGLVQLLTREQHAVQQRHCLRTRGVSQSSCETVL
jgi:hypothetical protein